ncbi:MAG: hypothetical protein JKY52_03030 [Flavobacteriales bacterium]|nr:hypothetical protein [Flavobacteriales bacterium]
MTTCPTAATDNGGCCAPPVAPTATAASGITKSIITGGEFTANWNAVGGATSYRLDISLSSTFASFVVNNLNVGNVTSHTKTGLDCSVTYYYRVRAFNGCASSNSNTITVVMTSCNVCAQQACEFTFGYGEWQCMCNACSCP